MSSSDSDSDNNVNYRKYEKKNVNGKEKKQINEDEEEDFNLPDREIQLLTSKNCLAECDNIREALKELITMHRKGGYNIFFTSLLDPINKIARMMRSHIIMAKIYRRQQEKAQEDYINYQEQQRKIALENQKHQEQQMMMIQKMRDDDDRKAQMKNSILLQQGANHVDEKLREEMAKDAHELRMMKEREKKMKLKYYKKN